MQAPTHIRRTYDRGSRRSRRAQLAGLCGLLLLVAALGAGSQAAAAPGAPALLHVVQNGAGVDGGGNQLPGGGKVVVSGPRQAPTDCVQGAYTSAPCEYRGFAQGETVTLTAVAAAPSIFAGWSDERCPAGPVATCTLALDEQQTVVALFTLLPITVNTAGVGTVKITPVGGTPCIPDNVDADDETIALVLCNPFPLGSVLALEAIGADPRWDPQYCDGPPQSVAVDRAVCTLTVSGGQRANVGFGQSPPSSIPQKGTLRFTVRKAGSGSGTILGSFNCRPTCSIQATFGDPVTLVARADAGSRFIGWTGACGTNPTCPLRVNKTYVTGRFDAAGGPKPAPRFNAVVGTVKRSGKGGSRRVKIPVAVSAPASLRAKLVKGARTYANRVFPVAPGGQRVLSLSVPSKAKAGSYKVKITIRANTGGGRATTTRSVSLKT